MTAALLHAEWTKFRTVRGWVIAAVSAALVIVLLALLTANGSHTESCINGKCTVGRPHVLLGPGGEEVDDSFYFVHQPLVGDGTITARISSLTGRYSPAGAVPAAPGGNGPPSGLPSGLQPWTKAGVMIKASTAQGSAYAAMLVTGTHGVRMQYDYTGDVAGPAGTVSAATPRWLRLTRAGDVLTGYESTDGTAWTRVGSTQLRGFPSTVQVGLFAASPDYSITHDSFGSGGSSGGPSWATARFDDVAVQGANPADAWRGADIGSPRGQDPAVGYRRSGASFVVTGSGDVAPLVGGEGAGGGQAVERTLVGAFAGLIVLIVLAALFVTGEYRRGLIRTTFAATPGRGQVLAAKAAVVGAVAFVVGLAAGAVSMHLGKQILQNNGNAIYPVSTGTEVRVIVGTAALLAVGAVFAVAVGALLRRGAGAVTALVAATVLPYILATAHVLPTSASQWLLRLTPAAAFAVQQTVVRYGQVSADYSPSSGFFPLAPWAGFAVLCGYTALAFAAAVVLVRRRDA